MNQFLKLIDKIIELFKERRENRRQLFLEVVKPLYDEFQNVLDKYFTFFRSARSDLISKPLSETTTNLRQLREEYIQMRIRLIGMIDAISESFPETDLIEFAEAMKEFFSPLPWTINEQPTSVVNIKDGQIMVGIDLGTPGNILLNRFEHLDHESTSSVSSGLLYIDRTIQHMEESWYNISMLFAKLKINYLINSKTIANKKLHRSEKKRAR